jgi:hypothetical protein
MSFYHSYEAGHTKNGGYERQLPVAFRLMLFSPVQAPPPSRDVLSLRQVEHMRMGYPRWRGLHLLRTLA